MLIIKIKFFFHVQIYITTRIKLSKTGKAMIRNNNPTEDKSVIDKINRRGDNDDTRTRYKSVSKRKDACAKKKQDDIN